MVGQVIALIAEAKGIIGDTDDDATEKLQQAIDILTGLQWEDDQKTKALYLLNRNIYLQQVDTAEMAMVDKFLGIAKLEETK